MRTAVLAVAAMVSFAVPAPADVALGIFVAETSSSCTATTCSVVLHSTRCSMTVTGGATRPRQVGCSIRMTGAFGHIPPPVFDLRTALCTGLGRGTLYLADQEGTAYPPMGVGFSSTAYGFRFTSAGLLGDGGAVAVEGTGLIDCSNPVFVAGPVYGTIHRA